MINILLNNDYPLKGNLNYFEAYMFATTERHIAKHYIMKGNIHLFDGSKDEEKIYSMDELETRKKALKEFNVSNKEDFEDNFSPEHYSVVLIDFEDEDNNYNIDEVDEIYKRYHEIHRDIARCEEIKKQAMHEVFEKVINEEENNQYEEQEDEYELEI